MGLVTSAFTYPFSVRIAKNIFKLKDFLNIHMVILILIQAVLPIVMNANALTLGLVQGFTNYQLLINKYPLRPDSPEISYLWWELIENTNEILYWYHLKRLNVSIPSKPTFTFPYLPSEDARAGNSFMESLIYLAILGFYFSGFSNIFFLCLLSLFTILSRDIFFFN